MNCTQALELAPLWLSAELDGSQREQFRAHLEACPACSRLMEEQAALDARIFRALALEDHPTEAMERMVSRRISSIRRRRQLLTVGFAAALLLVSFAGYQALRNKPLPRISLDAAKDHHQEVVLHQPRRWRTETPEVEAVAANFGLTRAKALSLAPDGYHLVHMKPCGLGTERALHFVFTDGARQISIYVRRGGISDRNQSGTVGTEHVATAGSAGYTAIVVASDTRANCGQIALRAASLL